MCEGNPVKARLTLVGVPLGLLLTPAVRAADLATLDKTDWVAVQAVTAGQVNSIAQLSDVRPTDWAYQALQSLVERLVGPIVGYPSRTFQENRPLSRFEFAARLNACLDKLGEATASRSDLETAKRLAQEFQVELASMQRRVVSLELENRTQEAQTQQFSTTTKLNGKVNLLLYKTYNPAGTNTGLAFASSTPLSLNTSFTGQDLLSMTLTSNTINSPSNLGTVVNRANPNGGYPFLPAGTLKLDASNGSGQSVSSSFTLSGLNYTFPVGDVTFVIGPSDTRAINVLETDGTFYNSQISYLLTTGLPNIFSDSDAGPVASVGFNWQLNPNWKFGVVYSAQNASLNGGIEATIGNGGFASAGLQTTTQISYKSNDGKVIGALAYAYRNGPSFLPQNTQSYGGVNYGTFRAFTGPTDDPTALVGSNNLGIGVGWAVTPNLVFSAAYGISFLAASGNTSTVQAWNFGLQLPNLFAVGNEFGLAFGQAPYVTASTQSGGVDSGDFAFETYYRFQVTDSISITPALYFVTNITGGAPNPFNRTQFVTGDLVVPLIQTTFRF